MGAPAGVHHRLGLAVLTDSVPLNDVSKMTEDIRQKLEAAAARAFSGDAAADSELELLEEAFASLCDVPYAVGVASGGAGLHVALVASGVGRGDEVIVPANGPIAAAAAVSQTGARVVFADIEPGALHIDPASVARQMTPHTRAVIATHLHGQMANLPGLQRVLAGSNAVLIEDASDALGGVMDGKAAGTTGRLGCFGFGGPMMPGVASGGMVVTSDAELAGRMRMLRDHGQESPSYSVEPGFDYMMSPLQAAVARVTLAEVPAWNALRQAAAAAYEDELRGSGLGFPRGGVFSRYVIRTRFREALEEYLASEGIDAEVPFPTPLHLQPAYLGTVPIGELPGAEAAAREMLALPMFPGISREQIGTTARAVRQFCKFSTAMQRETVVAGLGEPAGARNGASPPAPTR